MDVTAAPARLVGPAGSGAVAAGSTEVVRAAARMLAAGGGAVDAAVAGALTAVMSEPVLASLGGGGFLLVAEPDAPPQVLDFFVDVPGLDGTATPDPDVRTVVVDFARTGSAAGSSEQVFHGGWGTVAVPGCLDGVLEAHRRWGSLPLAEVVAPAREAAREGVVISTGQRMFLHLVSDLLNLTPESRQMFAEVEGSGRYANDQYAVLLEALAAGDLTGLADPLFADPLLAGIHAGGGVLTRGDLAAYRPLVRQPVERARGGGRVWMNPPPSVGGSIVATALDLIESSGAGGAVSDIDPAGMVAALVEATHGHRRPGIVRRGTTHLSVVDRHGVMAALTLSNGSGSGTVVPGWGVALNNMLGEEDLRPADGHDLPPGARMGSMMAPTLVQLADGARVALGTGGSERIRSAVLAVVLRLLDARMPLAEAVAAPRAHASESGPVHIEPGWPSDAVGRLDALAAGREWAPVEQWQAANLFFGGVHAVRRSADASVEAVGDVRRTGAVGIVGPDGTVSLA